MTNFLRRICAAAAAAAIVAAVAIPRPAAAASTHRAVRYYFALGDSIPYGFTIAQALAGAPAAAYHGFPDLVAANLTGGPHDVHLVNYSCPGESTISYLAPWVWRATGHPLHDDYLGGQRDAALTFLRAHRGHIDTITLSLNGNDINAFLATCPAGDISCLNAGAPAAIAAYQQRLHTILADLRHAAPSATIVVTGAYDPNVGAFAIADPLLAALNTAAADTAATIRARYADPMPVFNPPGPGETTTICALTLICTGGDPHPSAAGHTALAQLVIAALHERH